MWNVKTKRVRFFLKYQCKWFNNELFTDVCMASTDRFEKFLLNVLGLFRPPKLHPITRGVTHSPTLAENAHLVLDTTTTFYCSRIFFVEMSIWSHFTHRHVPESISSRIYAYFSEITRRASDLCLNVQTFAKIITKATLGIFCSPMQRLPSDTTITLNRYLSISYK